MLCPPDVFKVSSYKHLPVQRLKTHLVTCSRCLSAFWCCPGNQQWVLKRFTEPRQLWIKNKELKTKHCGSQMCSQQMAYFPIIHFSDHRLAEHLEIDDSEQMLLLALWLFLPSFSALCMAVFPVFCATLLTLCFLGSDFTARVIPCP